MVLGIRYSDSEYRIPNTEYRLAATFDSQDAAQGLSIDSNRDEIVAGRDLVRNATESAKAATTGGCSAKRLRDESQRAKSTASSTTASLSGTPQQRAQLREERRIGRGIARLTAAFTPGSRQRSTGGRGARCRLTGPLVESAGRSEGRSAPPTTATSTTASAKSKALRQSLHVTCEQ